MNHTRFVSIAAAMLAGASALPAQAVLRAAPSGRATSEVIVSYPRPAAGPSTAPGMALPPSEAPPAAVAPPKPLAIRLDYGQPHLRGRRVHTDSLVPYGKPWRAGANAATTLTTDVDLVVGGVALAKGRYVLYVIPARSAWTLVIQRDSGQGGLEFADKHDVARVAMTRTTLPMSVESLTMWMIPSMAPGAARGELRMAWGTEQAVVGWAVQ